MKSLKDTLEYRMSWLEKYNQKIDAALGGDKANGDPSASAGGAAYSASGMDPEKLRDMSLRGSSGLTVEQIDGWINSKAPKGSIMIGLGSAFIEAEKLSGNRADAILAHAAHESGWGTSNIVRSKYNWYGIGAFDSSPYASAHNFTGAAAGIINGAAWIADNYSKKGQDTYRKMRWNNGSHQYATDTEWDIKICRIWSTAPASNISGASGAGASVGDMNKSGFYTISGGHVTPPSGSRSSYNSTLANQVHSSNGGGLVDLPSDKFSKGLGDCTMKIHQNYLPGVLLIYNECRRLVI
jgi:beta-N-acetylglucosaminidase